MSGPGSSEQPNVVNEIFLAMLADVGLDTLESLLARQTARISTGRPAGPFTAATDGPNLRRDRRSQSACRRRSSGFPRCLASISRNLRSSLASSCSNSGTVGGRVAAEHTPHHPVSAFHRAVPAGRVLGQGHRQRTAASIAGRIHAATHCRFAPDPRHAVVLGETGFTNV